MSERSDIHLHERKPFGEELETPLSHAELRPPTAGERGNGYARDGDGGEVLIVEEGRLTADQRRREAPLRRLYHSLCGRVTGQYAPQSLLDAAGSFNRPPFPDGRSDSKHANT